MAGTGMKNTRSNSITVTQEELDKLVKRIVDAALPDAIEKAVKEVHALYEEKLALLENKVCRQENEIKLLSDKVQAGEVQRNHLEQYSRRSHLRVHGLKLQDGCDYKEAVASFLTRELRNRDADPLLIERKDIDAAHPLPPRHSNSVSTKTPPIPQIIVRFHSRELRDSVLSARRSLKGKGISLTDDLTGPNARLLQRMKNSEKFENQWAWGGKIYGIPKGKTNSQRFDIFDHFS